jgi:hypothetical protein
MLPSNRELCYGIFEVPQVPQRYQIFSLISVVNFYYIINKLIILILTLH